MGITAPDSKLDLTMNFKFFITDESEVINYRLVVLNL